MILQNISPTVVNGSRGVVKSWDEDGNYITIRLEDGQLVNVKKLMFTKFDPSRNCTVASRYQFPLKVAYGIKFKALFHVILLILHISSLIINANFFSNDNTQMPRTDPSSS